METLPDLIKGCISKDKTSQEVFYRKFYSRLMTVSLRMSPDKETAEDLLHDAYVKIYERLHTLSGHDEGLVFAWCKRILMNTIIDQLRKNGRRFGVVELDNEDYNNEVEFKGNDESFLKYKNLEPKDVMDAIAILPPAYKAVFNLVIDGYSHAEVSAKLGIVEGTSKSNYAKARYKLMAHLDKIGDKESRKLYFELN